MALPQLSPGPGRQLLQAVWELAFGEVRWPTFAELDRRLDSAYDLQALDVLREMPPGFLCGAGPGSPVPLPDGQEIGLTVAGVAACRDTSELLAVFVEFIQVATSVEKGWQPPPGRPDAMPGLTDAEFAFRARTLPAAGREHLLRLLFLVLQAERGRWAGFTAGPAAGHWAATFNQGIRVFRDVADVGDYWSRRFKPWESRTGSPAPDSPRSPGRAVAISGSQGTQAGDGGVQVNYFNFIGEYVDRRGDAGTGTPAGSAGGVPASGPLASPAGFAEGAHRRGGPAERQARPLQGPHGEVLAPLRPGDPRQVGGFTLLGRLGGSAAGVTYLASSPYGALAAVKVLRSGVADELRPRTRFAREADAVRRVEGPFVSAVLGVGGDGDTSWIATEYIRGPSLERLVRACGPLRVPGVKWLALGCAEALASIHDAGMVYRDLKPSNVLITAGRPVIVDAGMAAEAPTVDFTGSARALMRASYLAPEQICGQDTGFSADIFSLGATLVFAATGQPPFPGATVIEILRKLTAGPPDLSDLPVQLHDVVSRCLQRTPAQRPAARELIDLLRASTASGPDRGTPPLPGCALDLIEEYENPTGPETDARR